jgi:hypothetical protein
MLKVFVPLPPAENMATPLEGGRAENDAYSLGAR